MSNKTDDRTLGRELAFKYLFHINAKQPIQESNYSSEDLEKDFDEFVNTYVEPDDEHPDNNLSSQSKSLAKTMIVGVIENKLELLPLIEKNLSGRTFQKVNSPERCILLLSSYELKFRTDTPKKVVINEAVNLSKKYGDKDSFAFVNGVLDSFSKEN